MARVLIVRPEDSVETTRGAGDEYRFLVTGEDSSGSYFVMEANVPPGAGPPPHVQTREEEAFYVLSGEVVFYVDNEVLVAGQGTFLNVPRNVVHNFQNESEEEARLLIWFGPAGIEVMMRRMAQNPVDFKEIGKEYGVSFIEKEN